MTVNDSVVASSYDFSHVLTQQYGLLRYDWSKIAGIEWLDEREGVFCGEAGACSWPATDTQGEIKLNYSSDFIKRLMAIDVTRTRHVLKFISIGDNDDQDCEHSNVNFDLTVDYVVVK